MCAVQCCFMSIFLLKHILWFMKFLLFVLLGFSDAIRDDPTNNVPDNIFSKLGTQLYMRDIEECNIHYFDTNYSIKFNKFDNHCPIVSVKQVLNNTSKNWFPKAPPIWYIDIDFCFHVEYSLLLYAMSVIHVDFFSCILLPTSYIKCHFRLFYIY